MAFRMRTLKCHRCGDSVADFGNQGRWSWWSRWCSACQVDADAELDNEIELELLVTAHRVEDCYQDPYWCNDHLKDPDGWTFFPAVA